MKDEFSPIYFDGMPLRLLGDEARPPLSRIVRAGGQVPGRVDVQVLASPKDLTGHVLPPGEIIDRTVEPTKPIYLRSVPRTDAKPMTGQDPVIAQLGVEAHYLTGIATPKPALPSRRLAKDAEASSAADDKALSDAEAEAEVRQEEDREQDGEAQDDAEAEDEAREDREHAD